MSLMQIKTDQELDIMDRANALVHEVLNGLAKEIRPGVVLKDLDAMAEAWTRKKGAIPAFKGYRQGSKAYPASVCISINEEVVHGIPGRRRIAEGDIVSMDFGVLLDGFYGDSALTVAVGQVDEGAGRLLRTTRESLFKGIEQMVEGNRVQDVSHAVQVHAESQGYSVVRSFVGHGISRHLHEEPKVPNFGEPGRGPRLQSGLVLAIEPMVNEGGYEVDTDGDGWTVRTADGRRSAHFEYSVAVTPSGPRVLGGDNL